MGEMTRVGSTGTRRRWTMAEKLAIVAAAKTSGDPVSVVARRHGMNANHLFNWLQRDRDGTLDRRAMYEETEESVAFVDLGIVGDGGPCIGRGAPALEIELPSGAKVKVGAGADAALLVSILSAVKAAS